MWNLAKQEREIGRQKKNKKKKLEQREKKEEEKTQQERKTEHPHVLVEQGKKVQKGFVKDVPRAIVKYTRREMFRPGHFPTKHVREKMHPVRVFRVPISSRDQG